MTAIASRRRVRRCDVRHTKSEFWQHDENIIGVARIIVRALEWADSHGVSPEEAELLRREIRSSYWDEDVSALLGRNGDPEKPTNEQRYRVFRLGDDWLSRWLRALSELVGEPFPSGLPWHRSDYDHSHEEVTT